MPTASDDGLIYLDASALVKIVIEEEESAVLRAWIARGQNRISSVVTAVELRRAARRVAAQAKEARTTELERETEVVLGGVHLLTLDEEIARRAADLSPTALRSLDAIHLATALTLDGLEHFVTYDLRLADAAKKAGLVVAMPGIR